MDAVEKNKVETEGAVETQPKPLPLQFLLGKLSQKEPGGSGRQTQ